MARRINGETTQCLTIANGHQNWDLKPFSPIRLVPTCKGHHDQKWGQGSQARHQKMAQSPKCHEFGHQAQHRNSTQTPNMDYRAYGHQDE